MTRVGMSKIIENWFAHVVHSATRPRFQKLLQSPLRCVGEVSKLQFRVVLSKQKWNRKISVSFRKRRGTGADKVTLRADHQRRGMALTCSSITSMRHVSVVGPSPYPSVESFPSKVRAIQCDTAAQIFSPFVHLAFTYIEKRTANGAVGTRGVKMKATGSTVNKLGGTLGGASVLERPGLDQAYPDTAPSTEEGGEMGKASQKTRVDGGDRYRVLLLDHERHTEAQVAKVLPRVVPTVTPDYARKCFFESRELGFGLVIIAVKEHAEFYLQMMTRHGLKSTIVHDGTVE